MKGFRSMLAAGLLLGAAMQAHAITANFADGFGIAPVQVSAPGAIACGQAVDQCDQPLVFNNLAGSGVTLSVSGTGPVGAPWFTWHDRSPDFGGLGASNNANDNDSDNIFSDEGVILDFSVPVTIFGWWAFNHDGGDPDALNGAEYTLEVDGSVEVNDVLVAGGVGGMALNGGAGYTGSSFFWSNTGPSGSLMYVSAIEFRPRDVPEPASLGMLAVALLTLVGVSRGLARS